MEASGRSKPGRSRRAFLRAAGAAATAGLAGCGTRGTPLSDQQSVTLLAAGSLQHALETGLRSVREIPVQIESHGSATVARLVAEGKRDPDIVTVADTALFERPLSPSWYSVFASNAIVLAYDPSTDGGQELAAAGPSRWFEPLLAGSVRLGRAPPDQDPLGYRTLFTLELASRYYDDASDLRRRIPGQEQVYPETALISQFETGGLEAAFAYRNMAVERDYDFIELPPEIDLSDPRFADEWYSEVSYTLPSGQLIRGDVIQYGSTVRRIDEDVLTVFEAHTTGEYLRAAGFTVRESFPRYRGRVPDDVSTALPPSNRDRPGPGSEPSRVSTGTRGG
ncbi:MAG: extracellular solute-binding protein [Halobacteriaceae archaeon]